MRVPLSWMREYVEVDAPAADIAAALIRAGFEVEHVHAVGDGIDGVVVGEVLAVRKVEGSDKLSLVDVSTGAEQREIVCGASNFAAGDRVPVAVPGAVLPGDFRITERKVFGHVSHGMLCSAKELGLGDDHSGILVLDAGLELGSDVRPALGLPDAVLDIAVTPDRGYGFSVRGIAREVATAYDLPLNDVVDWAVPAGEGDGYPVVVEDTTAAPRFVARVVRGVDATAPSPLWLRRRLGMAGMRSISMAVDVTNYLMLGLGQPLHAYDLARLDGPVVVRRARAGERLRTLDDVERALHDEDLLITDGTGPLGLAGVMGGATSEVSAATRDVLVEAAHFAPVPIGRTSRRHGLSSEASKRFERGVDPDLPPVAAQIAVEMLTLLGGGTPDAGITDVDHRAARPTVTLRLDAPGRLAGRPYAPDVVRRRLADVGCAVDSGDPVVVTPPSWRPDLVQPVDLVDEVVRLEGYDTVPVVLPSAPPGTGLTRRQRLRRHVSRALADGGLVEAVRLANPISDEASGLRTTMLPGVLGVLARNVARGLPDVAVFETGPVFLARPGGPAPRPALDDRPSPAELTALDAALPAQPLRVAVALCGQRTPSGWWGSGRAAVWADAVEAFRGVATALHVELAVRAAEQAPYHPGRCAELSLDGAVVGYAGELHPRVLASLELPPGSVAGEIDLDLLLAAAPEAVVAPEQSPFPPATVDVALVVADATPAAEVAAALREGAGPQLEDLRLFDLYTGPPVPAGHRSLAFTLRFRAPDGTLTDEVVNGLRDAAVAEAARRTGAVLRA